MAGLIGAGQGLRNLANQGMAKVASADVQAEILREQEEMANEAGEKQLLGTAGGIGGMIGATKAMALTKAAGATAGGVTAAGTTAAATTTAAAGTTAAVGTGAAAVGASEQEQPPPEQEQQQPEQQQPEEQQPQQDQWLLWALLQLQLPLL